MRRSTALAISVITIASGSGLASLARLSAHGQSTPAPMNSAVHGGDLTGVWTADASRLPERVRGAWVWAFDPELPPMTAWAKERFAETKPTFGPKNFAVAETNDPVYQCYPPGTPRIYFHPFPMEIIQTPGRVLILYEYDHFIRQIFTDGRAHRDDLPSSWLGDSIGRWEGATTRRGSTGAACRTAISSKSSSASPAWTTRACGSRSPSRIPSRSRKVGRRNGSLP
jgi:hypothetical protein